MFQRLTTYAWGHLPHIRSTYRTRYVCTLLGTLSVYFMKDCTYPTVRRHLLYIYEVVRTPGRLLSDSAYVRMPTCQDLSRPFWPQHFFKKYKKITIQYMRRINLVPSDTRSRITSCQDTDSYLPIGKLYVEIGGDFTDHLDNTYTLCPYHRKASMPYSDQV